MTTLQEAIAKKVSSNVKVLTFINDLANDDNKLRIFKSKLF
jgi:hypothetical protein